MLTLTVHNLQKKWILTLALINTNATEQISTTLISLKFDAERALRQAND